MEKRLERCNILYEDNPPKVFVIIDENVIRRPIGGSKVMKAQLEHLVTLNDTYRAAIQIVPHSVGIHRGLVGSFILASFDGANADVAYFEAQVRGVITESRSDVSEVRNVWDILCAEALPTRLSTELIKEVAETWT